MKIAARRATVTERFRAEAAKKKADPLTLLFSGIGVVFVAAVGFILFGGGEPAEALRARFEALQAAGAELQMRDRPDDAAAKYREAIALVEADERYRSEVVDLRARLRGIAAHKEGLKEARARFDRWNAKVGKRKPEDLNDLILEGRRLLADVERSGVPWRPEFASAVEALEKERDERDKKNPLFEVAREEIRTRFLGPRDWSGAIRAWREWLGTERGRKEGKRGEEEIGKVHLWARGEFDGIRQRALRLAESGQKGDAIQALERERPRFDRTSSLTDLDTLRGELLR